MSGSGGSAAEVDPQGEDAVGELPAGVADDGEVLEVTLRLLHEPLTLGTGNRRQRAIAHRGGSFSEPGDHRVDVELVGHRVRRAPARGTRRCARWRASTAPWGS